MECSWAPLSLALWTVAKLLLLYLCLFDVIVGLYAMDEKFNDFLIENENEVEAYLIHALCFVYVVETFIILN